MRALAIKFGAIEIDARRLVEIRQAHRANPEPWLSAARLKLSQWLFKDLP